MHQNTENTTQLSGDPDTKSVLLQWLETGAVVVTGLGFGAAAAYKTHGLVQDNINTRHEKEKAAEIADLQQQKITLGGDLLVEKQTLIIQGRDTLQKIGQNVTLKEKLVAVQAAPFEESHPMQSFMDNGGGLLFSGGVGLGVAAGVSLGVSYLKHRLQNKPKNGLTV